MILPARRLFYVGLVLNLLYFIESSPSILHLPSLDVPVSDELQRGTAAITQPTKDSGILSQGSAAAAEWATRKLIPCLR